MTLFPPSALSSTGVPIVEVAELTRAFGSRKAVAGVTFSLRSRYHYAIERDAAAATAEYDA